MGGTIRKLLPALALACAAAGASAAGPGASYPALRACTDPGLQAGLERTLTALGLDDATARGHLGLVLADITDPHTPRVAEVNGDRMFYAASLPKIAILLGAFVEAQQGEMRLDPATTQSLTRMIRISSNADATRMLNRVGRERVLDILRSPRYRLYDPRVNGGLWVGKPYGPGPAYHRDPLHDLSHGATAMQTARFYYLLETDRLVSPSLTARMKAMLGHPGIVHNFVKGLAGVPGIRIFRKSGTWHQWHADSALVEAPHHTYIMVGLTVDPDGGRWLVRLARPLHRLVVQSGTARPETVAQR